MKHCKQSNKGPTDSWSTFPQRVGRIWYDLVTHGMLSRSRTARPTKGNLPIGLCSSLSLFKYLFFFFFSSLLFFFLVYPKLCIQNDEHMAHSYTDGRSYVRIEVQQGRIYTERLGLCTTAHIGLLRSLDPSIRSVS